MNQGIGGLEQSVPQVIGSLSAEDECCFYGTSHNRPSPSAPVTNVLLSGLKARLLTAPICPSKVALILPVAASHSLAVLSWLAVAIHLLSWLKATPTTQPSCGSVNFNFPVALS